jgi:ATP-dependent helicase YprA (DUF1998 family)
MRPWNGDPYDYERRLASGTEPLVILAEEHSGQVPLEAREQIEARFKDGGLNLLVCTMTLELGVDLGQLLSVILRNVPPRPSNYAQRAGRAGRREERVALIVTFAGGTPHDSYYYARPGRPSGVIEGASRARRMSSERRSFSSSAARESCVAMTRRHDETAGRLRGGCPVPEQWVFR